MLTSSSAMAERPREAWYFPINIQRSLQNHAQNGIFGPPYHHHRHHLLSTAEITNNCKYSKRNAIGRQDNKVHKEPVGHQGQYKRFI